MILYISPATAYEIYDKLFAEKYITVGYQAQKFNHNLIEGLKNFTKITALCALPYANVSHGAIEETVGGVAYRCVGNRKGKLRKLGRICDLIAMGKKIIKKERPQCIICDSIVSAASCAAIRLAKRFKIPAYAIVTDVPEKMVGGAMSTTGKITAKLMKKYDGYILLTEKMNEIVNPKQKPYIVMEGACGKAPERTEKAEKKIILYGGSLWKKNAGLEYFTEGFIKAAIPDTQLHYYGTGAFVEELEKIEKQYPSVRYMGCVTNEEMVKRQTEAALLVNPRPSDEEFCAYSFPSKTFEYMVSGTPALLTRLPGIPQEYFSYAYTIDEETADGVCEKLKEIFALPEDERNAKGERARAFVLEEKNYIAQSKKIFDFVNGLSLK